MWWTLLPWKSMYRRPATSSIQMPSARRIALRQGVETDWWRKASASRSMRSRLAPVMVRAAQARRRTEWLTSPSPAAGAGTLILFMAPA
jgi:hypothetical protein